MICPNCNGKLRTIDVRDLRSKSVRRRRMCKKCNEKFTTIEAVVAETKPGRRLEESYGNPVLKSLISQLEKRAEMADKAHREYVERIDSIKKTMETLTVKNWRKHG